MRNDFVCIFLLGRVVGTAVGWRDGTRLCTISRMCFRRTVYVDSIAHGLIRRGRTPLKRTTGVIDTLTNTVRDLALWECHDGPLQIWDRPVGSRADTLRPANDSCGAPGEGQLQLRHREADSPSAFRRGVGVAPYVPWSVSRHGRRAVRPQHAAHLEDVYVSGFPAALHAGPAVRDQASRAALGLRPGGQGQQAPEVGSRTPSPSCIF